MHTRQPTPETTSTWVQQAHGVSLRYRRRDRPESFRVTRRALLTLDLRARNPVVPADWAILVGLVGFFSVMFVRTAATIPGHEGLAFTAFMAIMAVLSFGMLLALSLERTVLSLDDDELSVRSGILPRAPKRVRRSELSEVAASFDQGWNLVALTRDGGRVFLARLTYPDQVEIIRLALSRALSRDD